MVKENVRNEAFIFKDFLFSFVDFSICFGLLFAVYRMR